MFAKPDFNLQKVRGDKPAKSIKLYKGFTLLSIVVILILLIIIVLLVRANGAIQSQQTSLSYPQLIDNPKEIINNLAKIYQLPNEDPSILTVADVSVAKKNNPEFYQAAKQNDILVVFKETGLAILYRAQENKIINVSKINFESTK